ncbi:MAG: glycosyltransferase family 4 protein [Pyrinomonadaceae bacterium]
MSMHSLYICYFGLREPLVQTQVLPYLRELQKDGHRISLLTFEPNFNTDWSKTDRDDWQARLSRESIDWLALSYHKRPTLPATLWDILAGAWTAARYARRNKVDIFHARNHVAAAMGLWARKFAGGKLIFDIRGFFPDEYVDAGSWPVGGYLYRGTKWAERQLLAAADGFVVLTEKARAILFDQRSVSDVRPVAVIPCCVDLKRFVLDPVAAQESLRDKYGLTGRRVIVYLGALGGWYLSDEMAGLFAAAHAQDPLTISLVLTQSDGDQFAELLRARGVPDDDFLILEAAPEDVPRFLSAADLALMFIKPGYSKKASSPTKLAEYLACGLPVICNAGIGDVDEVIETDRVGVLIREFTSEAYVGALKEADELMRDPGTAARCRESAVRRFDLERVGGERYRELYRQIKGDRR